MSNSTVNGFVIESNVPMPTVRPYRSSKAFNLVRANTGHVSATIHNVREFARQNKMSAQRLYSTLNGTTTVKGYRLERIEG
jgi:hypothetical protein